ncbi:MAG: hypothetical protein V1701_02075 [Planctomycetota bacterium]
MIDQGARKKAAVLIKDFRDGLIDNDEFVRDYPSTKSKDTALHAIYTHLWFYYADISKHRLTEKHSLTEEGKAVFNRCIAFLESDKEYDYPIKDFISLTAAVTRPFISFIISFSLVMCLIKIFNVSRMWALIIGFLCWIMVLIFRFLLKRRNKKFFINWEKWPFHPDKETSGNNN